jgi:transcriptional regulator
MYHIPHFKAQNEAQVLEFMQTHPFIVLSGAFQNGTPVATHIPVLVEHRNDRLFLQGHVMRKQNHHLAFEENPQVLAIFNGAHAYISAKLYPSANVASTWNYMTVHASGKIVFKEAEWLRFFLDRLTNHFEGNDNSAAAMKNMSTDYVEQNLKAIIGFEIEVTSVEHTFKISQNKNLETRAKIVASLDNSHSLEDKAMALAMKKYIS